MIEKVQLVVRPKTASEKDALKTAFYNSFPEHQGRDIKVLKRSIDARKKPVQIILQIAVLKENQEETEPFFHPKHISKNNKVVHIIGAGPAGMFAALEAIELGIKPIVFERGKKVRDRRRDLARITKDGVVNHDSNYCFGEGGAGTYSDGKLYTRSKKRGNVKKVLEWFVHFGADENILTEAHPHIGTNKLPGIIEHMRETILKYGGEIHFESKLTNIVFNQNQIEKIEINGTTKTACKNLILATGHSARDIFNLLSSKSIEIFSKSFALGVRVEHPQELITKIQYHQDEQMEFLPPASYNWVEQVQGRGVYSFCMCPGGIIAPCATNDGEVVTNGWSPSKRNNPYANSGIVVEVHPDDIPGEIHALKCLDFQRSIEQKAWEMGGKNQKVPAQRLLDFINGKKSKELPDSSYHRGTVSKDLNELFPEFIALKLKEGFRKIGKKMKGYLTNEAILHAPESRTSSPIRIPRDETTLQHISIKGLYPCGEGAGYAGGIVSAAVDGIKCIDKISDTQ